MKRCLIVDDSRIIRRVASKIMFELGFEPEEAEDGQQALESARVHLPHVAVIDWDMPVMDGISFLKELRKLPGGDQITVIFCAAENEVSHIETALDAGADEYVMKPFDSEIFRSKLILLGALD